MAGLGPEDFELRDGGDLREILSFDALDVALEPASPSREVRRITTNTDDRSERVLAVLWDDLHLSPPFAERARQALRPWLTERLAIGNRIVVVSTSGSWHVVEYAAGEGVLLSALDGLKGGQPPPAIPERVGDYEGLAISRGTPLVFEMVYRRYMAETDCGGDVWKPPCLVLSRAREAAFLARNRLAATLQALPHLSDVLAVGRGRKSIILVSLGLAFGVASLIKFAQGSSTTAMIVTSGMIVAMIDPTRLTFNAAYLVAAIGGGSLVGSWMNDSGFWIYAKMGGLTEVQTLKSWTPALAIVGTVAFFLTVILAEVLPLTGS